jgi:hypothetical protein
MKCNRFGNRDGIFLKNLWKHEKLFLACLSV